MSGFIIGAVIVFLIWIVVSMNSRAKTHQAFNTLDAAEPWLRSQGIDQASVWFSAYNDPSLSKHPGATVLVCRGKEESGSRVGFVLEVTAQGVIDAVYIEPAGIITHHRTAAQKAKVNNQRLADLLQEMARVHRKNLRNSGVEPQEKIISRFGQKADINAAAVTLRQEFEIGLDDLPHRKPIDELFQTITSQGRLSHEAQIALLYRLVAMNFLGYFKILKDQGKTISDNMLMTMVRLTDRSIDWSEQAADHVALEQLTSNLNMSITNLFNHFGYRRA